MEPQLLKQVRNIYIKKPECRSDINLFIAHIFKHDLKNNGVEYDKMSAKELLNEMVNNKLTSIVDIISAWGEVKSEYKNDISENAASKRENPKRLDPVSYKEYDMTDTHGNSIYSKGAIIYLKLRNETRRLGAIDPKQKVFACKRKRAEHLLIKNNSYGFNHQLFSTPTLAFDKILLEDEYGKYLVPVKYLLENGKYLQFLKQKGFERQLFLRLEIIETFKQEEAVSVEDSEEGVM